MFYRILADMVVVIHLMFIIFVVFGGLIAIRWRWILIFHFPSVIWGALIEFQGWLCPLTTLEWKFRQLGEQSTYHIGFIEYYLVPIVYPDRLTSELQTAMGIAVIIINSAIYSWILWRFNRKKH